MKKRQPAKTPFVIVGACLSLAAFTFSLVILLLVHQFQDPVTEGMAAAAEVAAPPHSLFLPLLAKGSGSSDVFRGLLFGLGPEADMAIISPLVTKSQAKVLSCWFNRSADLDFFRYWYESGKIANWWANGYVLHVITWEPPTANPATQPRPYHISPQFVADMAQLATYFSGPDDGRHVVLFSLATEFQTFIEPNNVYNGLTAGYYDQLQANLLLARNQIRAAAPNALVSFSWGGWQTQWDAPADGGGLSMISHFANTMRAMDFISFQAMQSTYPTNVQDIQRNTDVFRPYNPRLMVSHYKPDFAPNDIAAQQLARNTLNAEVKDFFTPAFTNYVKARGLFAFSFMSEELIQTDPERQPIIAGINAFTVMP